MLLCFYFLFAFRFASASVTPTAAKINEFPGSQCYSDEDCVVEGKCVPTSENSTKGYCRCFRSCPAITPLGCKRDSDCFPGNFHRNVCNEYKRRCMCPSSVSKAEMCTKKDVDITAVYADNDSPYEGEKLLRLKCCINMDSRSVFLRFFHNNSHELIATKTPIDALNDDDPTNKAFYDNCHHFEVRNVRFRDAGLYSCNVSIGEHFTHVVKNRAILVRAPIQIHLSADCLNSTSVDITWKTSPMNFSVNIKLTETMEKTLVVGEWINDKSGLVSAYNLKPATFYLVTATTEKTHNLLSDSAKVRFKTPEDLPEPPTFAELVTDNKQFTKCEMSWRAPSKPNGKIIRYEVHLSGVIREVPPGGVLATPDLPLSEGCPDLSNVTPDVFKTCVFAHLQPNRNYTGYVVAVNSAGKSPPAYINHTCMSNYGPPDHIPMPVVTKPLTNNTTSFNLNVQFEKPDQTNGPIVCYYMAVVPLPWDSSIDNLPSPSNLVFSGDARDSFSAVTHKPRRRGEGEAGQLEESVVAFIAESYQTLPEWTVLGDHNQSHPVCGVWYDGRYGSDDVPLRPGYRYTGFLIVRVEPDKSLNFLEAVRDRFRVKRNAWQLQPVYGYSQYFPPVVVGNVPASAYDDSSNSSTLLVVSLVALIALCSIIAIIFIYYFRRRHWWKQCFNRNLVPDRGSFVELSKRQRDFQPIPVEDLPAEYLSRHRDSDFLFAMEFEALPHYNNFDTIASDLPENCRKNRYNDIKAYDVSRVKLKALNGDISSDYINANFIQGYKGRKSFIAAQGPLADTVADFWRMLWEHNVSIVIMVANLHEKYRTQCTKYWPEEEANKYGNLLVKPVDAQVYSDYTIRKFEIRRACNLEGNIYDTVHSASEMMDLNNGECDIRSVVQYHYTGWHDYRAPECTTGLLRFVMRLRKVAVFSTSTVAVHCSAGVGRTGTFIAIDAILDQCIEEKRADVYAFVSNLRRQRNFMVQSLEQYVFIYKALAEWYTFGDTDIEVERIREHVKVLRGLNQSPTRRTPDQLNPMTLEYQKLSRSLENGLSCEFALKDCNESKNRFVDVVPLDRNRVILPPLLGTVDASYINASIIRGYSHPYILAQDPLRSTRWDMWRMICEHNASCVVSLTQQDIIPSEEKYWPEEGSISLGENPCIAVRLISEEKCANFVIRRLSFSHPKEKDLLELSHFSYLDWPKCNEGQVCQVPRSTSSLLQLIGKVLQRQSTLGECGSVVVHCADGSTRSGLYTAVSLILQRLKAEARVDVLQTVKSLQAQRPKVIASLAQYEFCYQAVLDYLESFC